MNVWSEKRKGKGLNPREQAEAGGIYKGARGGVVAGAGDAKEEKSGRQKQRPQKYEVNKAWKECIVFGN